MFFRRLKVHVDSFQERLDKFKIYNIAVQKEGSRVRAGRNGIGANIEDVPGQPPRVTRAGLIQGQEIGELVNAGYQQYWLFSGGRRVPALASQLKELHAFQEDLKEALGLTSLYNLSLGTISALHLYDRVEERDDRAHPRRPWESRIEQP